MIRSSMVTSRFKEVFLAAVVAMESAAAAGLAPTVVRRTLCLADSKDFSLRFKADSQFFKRLTPSGGRA